MKNIFIGFVIALLLLVTIGSLAYYQYSRGSSTCTASVRAPWYTIYIEIDENTLPEGIQEVRLSERDFSYGLQNNSDTPLYLVTDYSQSDQQHQEDFPNAEVPSIYLPLLKATQTETYYYLRGDSTETSGWILNAGNRNDELGHVIEITPTLLERMGNDFFNKFNDQRTNEAPIPNDHPITISVYLNDQYHAISGSAIYQRNQDYEQTIATKKHTNCQQRFFLEEFTEYALFVLLYGIPLVAIDIIYLAYLSYKKKSVSTILYVFPILYILMVISFIGVAEFVI